MIELEGGARILKQWSLDKRVTIDGFPEGTRVEISRKYDWKDSALPVQAYADGDHVVADIPNILLQEPGFIRVFVCPSAEDAESNPEIKDIRVVRAEKPEDYVYTPTKTISYQELLQRLEALEGEGIANAVSAYLEENPVQAGATADEAAQIAQNKENIEKLAEDKLDAEKLPEAINDALAQAKASGEFQGEPGEPGQPGKDGDPGKDGEPGKNYILTEADKQEIAGQAAQLVDVPTDDHINDLINTALAAIPNAAEVAY